MNTEITICRQMAIDDSEYWQLRLTVGNQTFTVCEPSESQEHAEWMADMLMGALQNAGAANVRVGQVATPFDRLPEPSLALLAALAADDGAK